MRGLASSALERGWRLCPPARPGVLRGGDDARTSFIDIPCVALPSAALSRSAPRSSEGAGPGSRMTPASAPPDVTAQLGRLMTEGAGHARTCPSRVGWGSCRGRGGEGGRPHGEKSLGRRCHVSRDRCGVFVFSREEERQLRYGDPSRFSPSRTVIENHVRGQSRDAEAAAAAAAFSRNTAKNKQQVCDSFRAITVLGVQVNDDVCKHG